MLTRKKMPRRSLCFGKRMPTFERGLSLIGLKLPKPDFNEGNVWNRYSDESLSEVGAEIENRYRLLMKECHPDQPGGDSERSVNLSQIVAHLRSLIKRKGVFSAAPFGFYHKVCPQCNGQFSSETKRQKCCSIKCAAVYGLQDSRARAARAHAIYLMRRKNLENQNH